MTVLDAFWVDSYVNIVGGEQVRSSIVLQPGQQYRVRIDGNWTAWADADHQNELWQYFQYGAGDFIEPKYHSLGTSRQLRHTQFNAEWWYADHAESSVPFHSHAGVQWDTGAAGFVHDVEPIGGIGATWDATDHIYDYMLTGTGATLGVRVTDTNRFDNDGMFRVTIFGEGGWQVGRVAWG